MNYIDFIFFQNMIFYIVINVCTFLQQYFVHQSYTRVRLDRIVRVSNILNCIRIYALTEHKFTKRIFHLVVLYRLRYVERLDRKRYRFVSNNYYNYRFV